MPVVVVIAALLHPDTDTWAHLSEYVLPRVTVNTLILVSGVAFTTAILGTGLAWLTAVCEFPGRRFFSWALLLPMAVPGYVMGFVAIGMLEYAGPVQTMLRGWFGSSDWFPAIRSAPGIILVMSLVLYPYVYLITRDAFLTQGRRALEVAQSLGMNRRAGFFKVALPMARPWIAGGVFLVMMETLADFGTVSVFNFDTFTTAIYQAWFQLFSIDSALQLSSFLLLLVLVVVLLEQRLRSRARYTATSRSDSRQSPVLLSKTGRYTATAICSFVFLIAFAIPFVKLLFWAADQLSTDFDTRYLSYVFRTVFLATLGAGLITTVALLLSLATRRYPGAIAQLAARIATTGYALPGTVLAVGVFVPLAALSRLLQTGLEGLAGDTGVSIMLQGSLVAMLLAYQIRFLAVAFSPVNSNMLRITPGIEEAASLMGVTGAEQIRKVHVPILSGGLMTAALLVFVDIMKEMPITLMTRPFGWETLAIRVFEMTSEGHWERAALPASVIVLVGLIPVYLLTRRPDRAA